MFRVGHLNFQPENDVTFNIFNDAVEFASDLDDKQGPVSNEPFGIWQEGNGRIGIIAIYYDGALFRPTQRDKAETKPLR